MNIRNFPILKLSLFVVAFSFFLIKIPIVMAEGIKITPNRIEAVVNPGEVIQKSIKILNNSNEERTLYLTLKDFKTKGNVGQVEILKGESLLDSWIKMSKKGIKFAPQEEKKISFTINVPKDAGPGGHYGAILIGGAPQNTGNEKILGDKGAVVAVNHQVTSLMLLYVTGDVIESANVKEFSADKYFYNTPAEVNFLTKIENTGNVHIKPMGMIQIENMSGEKIDTIIVNKTGGNIMPNSMRQFSNKWNKKFGFGKYTAKLILTYGLPASMKGSGQKTLSFVTEFWIFPVKIIIPLLGGILVAIFLFFLFFKFQKNKAVKRTLRQMGVSGKTRGTGQAYSSTKHFFSVFLFFFSIVLFIALIIYFIFFL